MIFVRSCSKKMRRALHDTFKSIPQQMTEGSFTKITGNTRLLGGKSPDVLETYSQENVENTTEREVLLYLSRKFNQFERTSKNIQKRH